MRKRILTEQDILELENLAKITTNKTVFRRLQCVLLRTKQNWTRLQIAQATGYGCRHVERIQQAYFENGVIAFERKSPAKAPRQYLSPAEEAAFLYTLEPVADTGGITSAKAIRLRLVAHLQQPISLSAVYGLLTRQGWSSKRPRPKHPQADTVAQTLFKKTGRNPK